MKTPRKQESVPRGSRPGTQMMLVGGGAALAWLVMFLAVAPPWTGWRVFSNALLLLLPLAGIAATTVMAAALRALRAEADDLREQLRRLRAQPKQPPVVQPSASPAAKRPPPVAQPPLPLEAKDGSLPPLNMVDLVRALHFPVTADDAEGFRSLSRALRDHKAGQVVRAAQDMLTLLSQDGLYMDDLEPDRAPPEAWRRFAEGEGGETAAAIGGIRDSEALARCSARLQNDTVFRDAAHHFLRRFDQMLGSIAPQADDTVIEAISETRSARAFMLVGRVAGMFG